MRGPRWGGEGVVPEEPHNLKRIAELADILWGHIQELDKYRFMKKRQPLDRKLKIAHAVSQLSAAYLKVVEADAVMAAVPTLQAQVQQLLAESRNGHGHPAASAGCH
jgi:hypothetical protein